MTGEKDACWNASAPSFEGLLVVFALFFFPHLFFFLFLLFTFFFFSNVDLIALIASQIKQVVEKALY